MKCLLDIVGVTLWHKVRDEDIFGDTGEVPVAINPAPDAPANQLCVQPPSDGESHDLTQSPTMNMEYRGEGRCVCVCVCAYVCLCVCLCVCV